MNYCYLSIFFTTYINKQVGICFYDLVFFKRLAKLLVKVGWIVAWEAFPSSSLWSFRCDDNIEEAIFISVLDKQIRFDCWQNSWRLRSCFLSSILEWSSCDKKFSSWSLIVAEQEIVFAIRKRKRFDEILLEKSTFNACELYSSQRNEINVKPFNLFEIIY